MKFSIKNKSIKIYNDDKLINNILWICNKNILKFQKSNKIISYNFYKIFDNIKISIFIQLSNNYIQTYQIIAFNKKYDYLIGFNPYKNKFNYFSSKNKKINKILMNAKKDFEKTVGLIFLGEIIK
jgi:hypothetical protein